MIASFDIFDTCLARRLGFPANFFYFFARKALLAMGREPTPEMQVEFVSARMQASHRALERSGKREITLPEIYAQFAEMEPTFDAALCEKMERELEAEGLFAIDSTAQLIEAHREADDRIIYISDTYFDRDFVEARLREHDLFRDGDRIFISSELNATKLDGSLFSRVLEALEVPPQDILHHGDHYKSDFIIPQRYGLRARHLSPSLPTALEEEINADSDPIRSAPMIAGAMRAYRLAAANGTGEADIDELVSQFLGPYLVLFARWCRSQAEEMGLEKLFFLARDCYLLNEVYQVLQEKEGGTPAQYLRLSRQGLQLPSIQRIEDCFVWLKPSAPRPSLRQPLDKLELTLEDIKAAGDRFPVDWTLETELTSAEHWCTLEACLTHEAVSAKVLAKASERREAMLTYLRGMGIFDERPFAVVDTGWALNCQKALYKVLREEGHNSFKGGLYLGLQFQRRLSGETGYAKALFYESPPGQGKRSDKRYLFSIYLTILEEIIGLAPHGSVHHYEMGGEGAEPVSLSRPSAGHVEFVEKLRRSVRRFAETHMECFHGIDNETETRLIIGKLAHYLFVRPSPAMARACQTLKIAPDQNNAIENRLVVPYTLRSAFSERLLNKPRGTPWPEADFAATTGAARRFLTTAKLAKRSWRSFKDTANAALRGQQIKDLEPEDFHRQL